MTVFDIENAAEFKKKALIWAEKHAETVCYLDNNGYTEGYVPSAFDGLLAIGVETEIVGTASENPFKILQDLHDLHKNWLFGFLTYDLKNGIEDLESNHFDGLGFPELHFFSPKILMKIMSKKVEIIKNTEGVPNDEILQNIDNQIIINHNPLDFDIKSRFTQQAYLATVERIKQHIQRGDIFEMNFCQEFFIENADLNPTALFHALNDLAQTPFATFYKLRDTYIMCASPERFLKKSGQSRRMKGIIN